MSQALRKLAGKINQTKTSLIFINQIRMKVGVRFGNPETTSGGRALKFYSSVRMDIRRTGAVKDGSDVIGNETRVRVKKNKVAPPFKKATFQLIYGEGISALGELVEMGVDTGVLEKRGSWYSYQDETVAQGQANVKDWLSENPEEKAEIERQIKVELGMLRPENEPEDEEEAESEEDEEAPVSAE